VIYTPTGDQVLVQMDAQAEHWDGEQLLARPDIGREMPIWGTVRAVGRGRCSKRATLIPVSVRPGQRVLVPWATGNELVIGGVYHRELHEGDILAVVE